MLWSGEKEEYKCKGQKLRKDDDLYPEEAICAGSHAFGIDKRGLLSWWSRGLKLWSSTRESEAAYGNHLEMQGDGNLVLYNWDRVPLWSTKTQSNNDAYTFIDEDGVVYIYSKEGAVLAEYLFSGKGGIPM